MGLCQDCVAMQLGVCRDLSFCLSEREPLMEEARLRAEAGGHILEDFSQLEPGYSIFTAQCIQCGQSAFIDVNPGPDESALYGDVLSIACPSGGAESSGEGENSPLSP